MDTEDNIEQARRRVGSGFEAQWQEEFEEWAGFGYDVNTTAFKAFKAAKQSSDAELQADNARMREALTFYASGGHKKLISNLSSKEDLESVKSEGWEDFGDLYNGDSQYVEGGFKAEQALSAPASDWLEQHDREVAAKALEVVAEYFARKDWRDWNTGQFVEDELYKLAQELRAQQKGRVE